ncbi:branched-chain amino acid ABC transporter permease [Dictyobacter vulcani]|uniref:Branched-chain amino acid ABC transporter permease n=1 Tax=Dictyobacter vulcani TaxID=2607529 RepID=A0A5J4KPI0_9CHLR|nr:branched-chain amino acid ABC transporter permease [Dictyobacter vulcani]GER91294.1 branched-chain amino acid ABC transporter permease [Dictyobacter vulcani]
MTQKPAVDQELAPDVVAQPELTGKKTLGGRLASQRVWLGCIAGILALILLPMLSDLIFGGSSDFQLHHISLIGIFILAALAQNILTGYAAQPSLGNAAFFGVSAYVLTWLSSDLGQPYWIGILAAVVVSALLGLIVGTPALRISGAHLAVATLGLVTTVGALLNFWDTTAGRQNYDLSNLPDFLNDDRTLYYFIFAIVVCLLFLSYHLLHSRVGRAWIAIRDNETAAEAFGINLTKYKLQAFVISAAMTGLAGSLYATWATTASSSMSSADQTIAFLAMIVVGGLGSLTGSILGAIFVGFLPLLLGQLPSPMVIGSFQLQISTLITGIYGLLLLLVLIFFPSGLSSLGTQAGNWLQRKPSKGGTE